MAINVYICIYLWLCDICYSAYPYFVLFLVPFIFFDPHKVVCRLLYNFCGISIYEGFCLDSCVLLIEPNLAAWEYTHTHRHTYSQLGILACQSYSVFHIPWFSIAAGIHILGLVNGKSMHSMYICTGYQAKSISIILIFLERGYPINTHGMITTIFYI